MFLRKEHKSLGGWEESRAVGVGGWQTTLIFRGTRGHVFKTKSAFRICVPNKCITQILMISDESLRVGTSE